MKKTINIINLDCPNCAKELEEEILKVEGVNLVNVDFMHQRIHLQYFLSDVSLSPPLLLRGS